MVFTESLRFLSFFHGAPTRGRPCSGAEASPSLCLSPAALGGDSTSDPSRHPVSTPVRRPRTARSCLCTHAGRGGSQVPQACKVTSASAAAPWLPPHPHAITCHTPAHTHAHLHTPHYTHTGTHSRPLTLTLTPHSRGHTYSSYTHTLSHPMHTHRVKVRSTEGTGAAQRRAVVGRTWPQKPGDPRGQPETLPQPQVAASHLPDSGARELWEPGRLVGEAREGRGGIALQMPLGLATDLGTWQPGGRKKGK